MEGIPFAECYTVDTKWRITEADKKCRIQIWVKVNFIRTVSLVKGKIERSSVQGVIDYFKNYAKFLRQFIQETGVSVLLLVFQTFNNFSLFTARNFNFFF